MVVISGFEREKLIVRLIFLAFLALILPSCEEKTSEAGNREASPSIDVGFEAIVTGSYEGEVSGTGVLLLLPEAGFEKQGYYFLSDGQGIRPHGVTFVLPRGLTPGKHMLGSPSPFDLGTVPSATMT